MKSDKIYELLMAKKWTKRDVLRILKGFNKLQIIQKAKNLSIDQVGDILDQMWVTTFS
jgi:hypothetical protein